VCRRRPSDRRPHVLSCIATNVCCWIVVRGPLQFSLYASCVSMPDVHITLSLSLSLSVCLSVCLSCIISTSPACCYQIVCNETLQYAPHRASDAIQQGRIPRQQSHRNFPVANVTGKGSRQLVTGKLATSQRQVTDLSRESYGEIAVVEFGLYDTPTIRCRSNKNIATPSLGSRSTVTQQVDTLLQCCIPFAGPSVKMQSRMQSAPVAVAQNDSPAAAPRAKSDVFDCLVLIWLFV